MATQAFLFLDQIGQPLINQGLELSSFAACQIAHRLQDPRIHLSSECLAPWGGHDTSQPLGRPEDKGLSSTGRRNRAME